MALTPRSGSPITSSALNAIPGEIPNTQPDLLDNMPFISDTNLNKYAIDPTQYPNMTNMLAGFAKGHRVNVTYYRMLTQDGSNIRTNVADYASVRNILDSEYQKILALEITLPSAFVFAPDPSQASVSITGQALLYPNMNPNIGDIFLIGTGDGRIGLARISAVSPLSWRTDRFYAVSFMIQSFAQTSDIAALDNASTITSVFSKENYLQGTAALLSEQTYLYLQQIKTLRSSLCKYYHRTFFDNGLCSYLRPDGLYDITCVQFMSAKITMDDLHIRPKNLLGRHPNIYDQSIWARLDDRYNLTLNGVSPYQIVLGYNETRMGVFVTELSGYQLIFPSTDNTQSPYLFTTNFWTGNTVDMTALELLIYTAITTRSCGDLGVLVTTFLSNVFTLSTMDQYYNIPLYIHLIDMALQTQWRDIDSSSMDYAFNGS